MAGPVWCSEAGTLCCPACIPLCPVGPPQFQAGGMQMLCSSGCSLTFMPALMAAWAAARRAMGTRRGEHDT